VAQQPAVLADACEALLAALYLDGGLAAVQAFIARHWIPLIEIATNPPQDAKTALQEWAQARGQPLPRYHQLGRIGPDHAPTFRVEVRLPAAAAEGTGPSLRRAEQAAAMELLQRLTQAGGDG
jgi:ribonuclease-3